MPWNQESVLYAHRITRVIIGPRDPRWRQEAELAGGLIAGWMATVGEWEDDPDGRMNGGLLAAGRRGIS